MSEEVKRRLPLTHIVHDINHTQVNRSAVLIHSEIDITTLADYESGKQWTNLIAGIYKIEINSITYAFDIYMNISDGNYLQIDTYNKAYMMIGLTCYPIILYEVKKYAGPNYQNYSIDDTINNWFDALIINGYTEQDGTGTIDAPTSVKSLTSLTFNTTGSNGESENVTINLRNYIKSLPNGVHDTCIINTELQKYHITTRVGRTIFSGYENWRELTDHASNGYSVFFCQNTNVSFISSSTSMRCSHLPVVSDATLLKTSTQYNCIATSTLSVGKGFLIKVSDELLEYVSNETHENHFQNWLNRVFTSGSSMVIEYPLDDIESRDFLIEEYHVPTYYLGTNIVLDAPKGCNFSYFYKSL